MIEQQAVKTRVSNTGSNSQTGFSIGVDWLTYTHDNLRSGDEVNDVISALESLAGDQIDFATNRARHDNHKFWAGSGRSQKGLLLWYNPPRSSDDLLIKSSDGNLLTHPGLLPAPHCPVSDLKADVIRSYLPDHAELHYDAEPITVYDPIKGTKHQHHGYSIVSTDDGAIETPGELRVSMSARYLDHVSMNQIAAYLNVVSGVYGLRCSRFDVALDDHEKQIPLALVEQARRNRNYFNVRSTSVVNSDDTVKNTQGKTIYFGSRQSDAFMRCYDKTVESKGKRIGNRWETEFHDKKADRYLKEWLSAMESDERTASKLLVSMVLGTVDFRDRTKGGKGREKNRKRCAVLPWFDEMCKMLKSVPVRLRIARPQQSLQRGIDWLKKSAAPTIASAVKVLGSEFAGFFNNLVKDGEDRLTNVRRKMIEDADISQLCY